MKRPKASSLGIVTGISAVLLLLGTRGCSMAWNNWEVKKTGYRSRSFATGISGHTEYTLYSDGSQDVKIYHGLGHRAIDSELLQDLDGDGKVDRIRVNGSEIKMNSLRELLIREHDYDEHKERFDEADEEMQELAAQGFEE